MPEESEMTYDPPIEDWDISTETVIEAWGGLGIGDGGSGGLDGGTRV
jgi:hypothetical protein